MGLEAGFYPFLGIFAIFGIFKLEINITANPLQVATADLGIV